MNNLNINQTIDKIYWEILADDPQDQRISLLKSVISDSEFDLNRLIEVHNSEINNVNSIIISELIHTLKHFHLGDISSQFKIQKKNHPNHNNLWSYYYDWLSNLIIGTITNNQYFNFISVGCGSGLNESRLSEFLESRFPNIKVNWIGLDISNYLSSDSVISKLGMFHTINDDSLFTDNFHKTSRGQDWVFCDFAAHHMLITPEGFIKKCSNADKIILLEQLIQFDDYQKLDYRIARIGYDIISNALKNPAWINLINEGKADFKIDLWNFQDTEKFFNIINFPAPHSRNQILINKN